jgi:hypothetical protein
MYSGKDALLRGIVMASFFWPYAKAKKSPKLWVPSNIKEEKKDEKDDMRILVLRKIAEARKKW